MKYMALNVSHYVVGPQAYLGSNDSDLPLNLHHHQEPFTNVTIFELAPLLSSPTSAPSHMSISPSNTSDSKSLPHPYNLPSVVTSRMLTTPPSNLPTDPPALSQPFMEWPQPSSVPASVEEDQELVGRCMAKPGRRLQLLACFFCHGRKIACVPQGFPSAGDQTCKYVVICLFNSSILVHMALMICIFIYFILVRPCVLRKLNCQFPTKSYRGYHRPS